MKGSKFEKQKFHVLLQFAFYETSFFGLFFLQFLYIIGAQKDWSYFDFALGDIIIHFMSNVFPNLFMLWSHHILFKKQIKKRNRAKVALLHAKEISEGTAETSDKSTEKVYNPNIATTMLDEEESSLQQYPLSADKARQAPHLLLNSPGPGTLDSPRDSRNSFEL